MNMRLERELIKKHLESIHPSFTIYVEKFGDGEIKDISRAGYFDTKLARHDAELGFFGEGNKNLELGDLIAVHLTDTFPEDGILRTRFSYDPSIIRDTIHFSINGSVGSHMYGNWDNKRYAILVPLERIKDRIVNYNPVDTFILGDLELSESSWILSNFLGFDKEKLERSGNATCGIVSNSPPIKYYTKDSYSGKLKEQVRGTYGFRKGIYEAIINEGYCPMEVGMWNWVGWGPETVKVHNEFARENGWEYGKHDGHWTEELEKITQNFVGLEKAIPNEEDREIEYRGRKMRMQDYLQEELAQIMEKAERFINEYGDSIPGKYTDLLSNRVRQMSEYKTRELVQMAL